MQSKLASINATVIAGLTENWPYLWKLQIHKAVAFIVCGILGGAVMGFAAKHQPEDIRQWLLWGHILAQLILAVWWFWSSYNVFRIGNLAFVRRTPHFLVVMPIGLAILVGGVGSMLCLTPSFLDGMQQTYISRVFLRHDMIDSSWIMIGEAWLFLLFSRILVLGGYDWADQTGYRWPLAVPFGLTGLCAVVVWLWGTYWGAYLAVIATISSASYAGVCWFSGKRLWHGDGFVIALIVLPQFAAGLALVTMKPTLPPYIITLSFFFAVALWTDLISYLAVEILMLPGR